MMKKNGFSRCAEMYIGRLRKEGRYSTAHVYENALFSFRGFCGTSTVSFGQITREHLRCYGQYLYERGLKPNTVSTYMRMLRSIYNRGVESGRAPYVHRLFHGPDSYHYCQHYMCLYPAIFHQCSCFHCLHYR